MTNASYPTARRLLALLAETPVHAGTGTQLGVVDLPIQRERHTEWPTIYGSGIKGVLRDHAEREWGADNRDVTAVFGPATEKASQGESDRFAGAFAVSDARVLLFPVRTIGPAFAWVTCPLALARLVRDAAACGLEVPTVDETPSAEEAVVSSGWRWGKEKLLIEEFDYKARCSVSLAKLGDWLASHLLPSDPAYAYWHDLARCALVMVAEGEFRDFVRHATEVVTRVRLGKGKTVERGALWTEENLPADTLLYSLAAGWMPARVPDRAGDSSLANGEAVLEQVARLVSAQRTLQIGGKETVGRGFMAARLV